MLHNVTEFRKHTILAADRTIGDIKGSCAVGIATAGPTPKPLSFERR
jgi:hypothetical protein